MMRITQVAVTAAIIVPTVLSTGCSGKSTIKPDGAAKSVVDVVSKQTGFHPSDVHCPDGSRPKWAGSSTATSPGRRARNTSRT